MSYNDPQAITNAGIEAGVKKALLAPNKALVAGFLAGAYIAFGGLLAIVVSSGLDPARWGGLITLVTGSVFTLGLILVVIAGSELLTGNMALVPLAAYRGRISLTRMFGNFWWVLIGNLLGSLFVAYFLAVKTGIVTAEAPLRRLTVIATLKGHTETDWQIFLRALGCNWLVCLAVWMSLGAQDVAGKILAIFFPIMGFVAMGFDHVVANMFFLPAAIWAGTDAITWGDALHNWVFAFLGNFVGAAVFVAGSYYYLYGRAEGLGAQAPGDMPRDAVAGGGDGRGGGTAPEPAGSGQVP
jgi:formate/nitrite transporter